jgi:CspA family cold shock protein
MGSILGKVKWFNERRGMGLIIRNGPDLFVKAAEVKDHNLKGMYPGREVTFDIRRGPRGEEASNVEFVLK